MHYLGDQKNGNQGVQWIEVIQWLESKMDVSFIGPNSKFLSYSNSDFKKLLAANVVRIPDASHEEFMASQEFSVLVTEVDDTVISMHLLRYEFPMKWNQQRTFNEQVELSPR